MTSISEYWGSYITACQSKCSATTAPSLSLLQWKRVEQGCVIAPTLFAIFIAAILHLIGEELPQEIPIMYRTDGRLFNLNRFKAKSKVYCTTITELQYADDNFIAAHSAEVLQGILNAFARAYRALGLKLNVKKMPVLHQSPPNIAS